LLFTLQSDAPLCLRSHIPKSVFDRRYPINGKKESTRRKAAIAKDNEVRRFDVDLKLGLLNNDNDATRGRADLNGSCSRCGLNVLDLKDRLVQYLQRHLGVNNLDEFLNKFTNDPDFAVKGILSSILCFATAKTPKL